MAGSSEMTAAELRGFLRELSPDEAATFRRMEAAWQSRGDSEDLAWYHAFGRGVLDLRGDAEDRPHGWMGRLARALDCSRSLLNKARDFARQYNAEEARRLAREKITWGMVYPTFPLGGKQEQLRWMRAARDNRWTVKDLGKRVQEHLRGPHRRGGRRPCEARSFGPAVDLQGLIRLTGQWLQHRDQVWAAAGGTADQLDGMPADELRALDGRLAEAEQRLSTLRDAASRMRVRLMKARERLQRGGPLREG